MRSPAVEFRVAPATQEQGDSHSHEQAAQNIANLLNTLAPEQLESIDRQLQSINASTYSSTKAEDALAAELTDNFQPSTRQRQTLELTSLLRNFEWRRELLADSLSASEVAQLLGTTRQTPHDRVRSNSLLAVLDKGVWRFPAWQFDPHGSDGVVDGLPQVLQALQISPIAKVSWLVRPNQILDGLAPIAALKQGQKQRVLAEAVGVGVN